MKVFCLVGCMLLLADSCQAPVTPRQPVETVDHNVTEVFRVLTPSGYKNVLVYSFDFEGHTYLVSDQGALVEVPKHESTGKGRPANAEHPGDG